LLGCSLLHSLETWLFGESISTWVKKLSPAFAIFIWVWVADAFSGNIKLLGFLATFLRAIAPATLLMLYYVERCGLHQCGRIAAQVMEQQSISSVVFSMSKVMQLRRQRREFRNSLVKAMDSLVWLEGTPPPETFAASQAFRDELFRLATGRWDGEAAEDLEEREEHVVAIRALLAFFNGDLAGRPTHCCPGRHCCKNYRKAKARAKKLLLTALFRRSVPEFNTQRWKKQIPALSWWLILFLVHNLAAEGFLRMSDPKVADGAGLEVQNLQALLGERVKRGRSWAAEKHSRFRLMLVTRTLLMLEHLVNCLFGVSEITVTSDAGAEQKRKRRRRRGKSPANATTAVKGQNFMIMSAVDTSIKELSLLFVNVAPLAVLMHYWPSTSSREQMFWDIRGALLTALVNLYF
jgi:hypothetical protein